MNTLLVIANVTGYIGFIVLYFQVVLGSRHIFSFFTNDTVAMNKMHANIGKYAVVVVLLHPVLSMMDRLKSLAWIIVPNFSVPSEVAITYGRAALVLFVAVWVTSAIVRGKIKWQPWKRVHLLAYPLVLLIFPHIRIGTFYESYSLVRYAWLAFLLVLIISLVYRLLTWAGLFKAHYTLVQKSLITSDIALITLLPTKKKAYSKIGQHFYLQSKRFGTEHPYSIIYNKDGTLTFGMRKDGKFWTEVMTKEIGQTFFVDGPYGTFTREAQNTLPKVIISGGIGVTPFVDLVDTFGQNTIYINCNRTAEDILYGDVLKAKSSKYLDIIENYAGQPSPSIMPGRVTPQIIKEYVGQNHTSLSYFVCGSPVFVKVVCQMLHQNGVNKKMIYFEELGY